MIAMSNVFPLHRYRMTYGMRRIYAEDVRAAPIQLKPAHNPIRPYPYFLSKLRRYQTPLTTLSVRNPRYTPPKPAYIHNEAFNPDTWWNSAMRDRRPWVSEVESYYKNWPLDGLLSGILV